MRDFEGLELQKLQRANFTSFVSFLLGENLLKHLFWTYVGDLNPLKLQKLENTNFTLFFSDARLVKTTQNPLLTRVRSFESCEVSKT